MRRNNKRRYLFYPTNGLNLDLMRYECINLLICMYILKQEKMEKIALKAQAAEMKKMQKEIERWEKGKFSQQSIVAKIDTKVVEQGSIGGTTEYRCCESFVCIITFLVNLTCEHVP